MHLQDMPKGQRQVRSQGIYRQSPMVPTSSSHYNSHPMARTSSQINMPYYSNTAEMMHQAQQQQTSSYNAPSYANGGPVQHPVHYSAQPVSEPSVSLVAPTPPVSLRPSSGAWSPQDDSTLMSARASGMNWLPIQQTYFTTKTANACRKRHERLMEKRNADDWDGLRMERLATAYMGLKREMWSILADACGEKWTVVEAKCMSQGLKNLATHARSNARRERLADNTTDIPATPTAAINITQSSSAHSYSSSLPHTSNSHSHSTSLSSIHSNPQVRHSQPSSNAISNHDLYLSNPGSFNSNSGMMQAYDDSGLGAEIGELEEADYEHEHDPHDGTSSERSRSAGSVYGHHNSNSLGTTGYGHHGQTHGHNRSSASVSSGRGWAAQQMLVGMNNNGMSNNGRLPSLQEGGMGIDRILDRNGR